MKEFEALIAAAKELRGIKQDLGLPLSKYITKVSPHLDEPKHLKPITDAFDSASTKPVRLVISTPPQHGKSETGFHGIVKWLTEPRTSLLFLTYNEDFAVSQMKRARIVAADAGLPITSQGFKEWSIANGSTLYATGIGGSVTGRPGNKILIDDPIKDWVSAQSKRIRDNVDEWLQSVVLTRTHPDSSIILIQTRWHVDDIAGRLIDRGWDHINLPAIDDDGNALWEDRRPIEWLREQQAAMSPHIWSALYMGNPTPREGSVFKDVQIVDIAPQATRYAIGIDLAYSRKTKADHSAAVVIGTRDGSTFCVVEVIRARESVDSFGDTLKSLAARYKNAPMVWHHSGVEKGSADMLRSAGVPIMSMSANTDKFIRAQPLSVAWNNGRVFVKDAHWTDKFVEELQSFTGVGDEKDDQVDAAASAFYALTSSSGSQVVDHVSSKSPVSSLRAPTRSALKKLGY